MPLELKNLRTAQSLSQGAVARSMGVSWQRIQQIERASSVRPSTERRYRAAVAAASKNRQRMASAFMRALGCGRKDFENRKIGAGEAR